MPNDRGFRDRLSERETLEGLLRDARGGRSSVLVVRGEAGIGKSALLQEVATQASGFNVAQIAGVESEMELPFAGLHQLLAPMLGRLDGLPPPQERALRVALGLASGDPPDRFLVALGTLTLLAGVADEEPFLCIVEDAQWLDEASRQVLGFVARRLLAEPVALMFAVREPGAAAELSGLPELLLDGLDDEDARALLATVIPGRLDDRVRDRIVAETRGNPLALLELPRGLSTAELAGGFGMPDLVPLSGRIEESFERRLDELPEQTRLLLLVAAAEPAGDPAVMWRAAKRLGIPNATIAPATQDGLLDVRAKVRFRHPLVRSAVYRSASEGERRSAHAALAEVTDAGLEPDRRAWHRAHAAQGPDEEVADELERSADRAQGRGGFAAAAAFLGRAADLTVDPARRAERLLAAAQASLQAGAFDAALALIEAAESGPLDELGRARLGLLQAQLAFAHDRGSEGPALLLEAAKKFEPLDASLSRDTYLDAWSAALFTGQLATAGSLLDVSRAVRIAPDPGGVPRACDLLLDGFAMVFTEGRAAAEPVLRGAVTAFAGPDVSAEEMLRWGWLATIAAVYVWNYDACRTISTRQVEVARQAGALEVLAVGDNIMSEVLSIGGDYAGAALLVAEAEAVSTATGALVDPYAALVLAGHRGDAAQATGLIEATIREATPRHNGTAVQLAHYAKAMVMNGLGRYEEAVVAAVAASEETPEMVLSRWALSELVEAASRTQNAELAERAAAGLAEHASGTDSDWALGILARGHALLNDGKEAERLYREAIDHLSRTELRPDLARGRLLYGEWLRRQGRRVDAREQLRAAHDALASIGADAFAERARRELLATGEKARSRRDDTRDELTPQEEQIARLARDRLTNPEIASQLFLSPRTVEWHLRKVYAKLEISSRRDLRSALPEPTRQAMPV